jgi:iron complex outermembrane recepter protein
MATGIKLRGQLTKRCVLCLILVSRAYTVLPDEAPAEKTLPVAIAAQPLPQALAVFSDLTHLQLVYVSQLALGKVSHATPAGLSASATLARLLEGTGLNFVALNGRTIKLFEPPRVASAAAPIPGRELQASTPVSTASLEEVVVSATKRDEYLSAVPMSISVLSEQYMDAAGINDISGVAAATTGVEYDFSSQYGPGILTNIAIRGISAEKNDVTTGIYIDDTPIQMPHTTFGNPYPVTFDLAQVEVLRGPQGVLFGRSAEGGAVRFITSEPSTTTVSDLYRSQVSSTDDGSTSFEVGTAVGGPLIDDLLGARVSVWYRNDGGYVNRVDPFTGATIDANANHSASEALRVGFAVEPNDSLRIIPSFSYQSVRLHDTPIFYVTGTPEAGDLENGKLLRQPSVDSFTLGSVTVVARLGSANLTAITSYFDRTASATVDTTNAAGVSYFGGFGNPLGPAYPTSYADAIPTLLALHQIQVSEEVRLASTNSAAPLTWLGGLFFSNLRQNLAQDTYEIAAPTNPGILTDGYSSTTEISAFGQVRWSFTPYLSLGAGMRFGWLHSQDQYHNGGFVNAGSVPFTESSHHENLPPTPRFDLSYQPDSHNLFYVSAAKGFRSGGSNGVPPPHCGSTVDPAVFAPDSVWSFEVGAKNELLDRRMQINTSLYDIYWNGIQEDVADACGNGFTANAGAARSSGFDLDAQTLLTDRLQVALAVGLVDVRYTRTVMIPSGLVIVDRGTVVGGVPSVPAPWSGRLSARYEWPLGRPATAYVRAEDIAHSHNPGPFSELDPKDINYDPQLRADPATNLLNLQLGLLWSRFDVRLFVNNALNALPVLQRDADAPGSALQYAYTFRPRTVGVAATGSF